MGSFMRIGLTTGVLAGAVLLVAWRWSVDEQQRAIAELTRLNEQMAALLAEHQEMVERLSRSRRIAHIVVDEQRMDDASSVIETTVSFIELNEQGAELARQQLTLPGDVLYIDALTVKFDPEFVAKGDPLRGRTLILLRRMYSEEVAPKDGTAIDTPGAIPPGYAASDAGRFEMRLWENFWEIASNPKLARELGVRVAQGEAVYQRVRSGERYELIVDNAGGMSLTVLAREG